MTRDLHKRNNDNKTPAASNAKIHSTDNMYSIMSYVHYSKSNRITISYCF